MANYYSNSKTGIIAGVWMMLIGCISPLICLIMNIRFNQECGGFLKQAADANSVELALERIDIALGYIEKKGLTSGYTSVLYKTENENIGYWYENIKACKNELASVSGSESQLERSNVLMKIRESLTDNGEKGTELTVPPGISRYPYNVFFCIFNILSILLLFFGYIVIHNRI